MPIDFNLPKRDQNYDAWLQTLRDAQLAQARLFENEVITNPQAGIKRLAGGVLQEFNGASWVEKPLAYLRTGATAAADVNTALNATRVLQAPSNAANLPLASACSVLQLDYNANNAGAQVAIPASSANEAQRLFFRGGAGSVWGRWTEAATLAGTNTFTGANTFTGSSKFTGTMLLPNSAWLVDEDSVGRLYFSRGGNSYYKSPSSHVWRDANDNNIMSLSQAGALTVTAALIATAAEESILYSTNSNPLRMLNAAGYLCAYNGVGGSRSGYLQFNAGDCVRLAAENGASIELRVSGTTYATLDTAGVFRPGKLSVSGSAALPDGATVSGREIGYRGLPQVTKSANYVLAASDAGCHLYHPSSDAAARTWTIPAGVFPQGTVLTFANLSAGVITLAGASGVSLRQSGSGDIGSTIALARYALVTALEYADDVWLVSGVGMS